MIINKLQNVSNVKAYSGMHFMNSDSKQHAINFQHSPAVLKKGLITASLALAALGVSTSAHGQNDTINNSIKTENIINPQNILGPQNNMGKYFAEHGFTPEQRKIIADLTEEYATKYYKQMSKAYIEHFQNCSYFSDQKLEDSPANPFALNLDYYMGKANKYAKSLTEFRLHMQLIGAVGEEGHYSENPTLDPIKDNEDAIKEVLGDNVTYEQYVKDNKETIDKLNNLTPDMIDKLSYNEQIVFANMTKVIHIMSSYTDQKGKEYKKEAKEGFKTRHTDRFFNDMEKLQVFRTETNSMENTYFDVTDNGHAIYPQFEYFWTNEGFNKAVCKVYTDILANQGNDAPDAIIESKANSTNNLMYNISGNVVKNPTKSGLYIKDGKTVFIKK